MKYQRLVEINKIETVETIHDTKNLFFEKMNKIHKSLGRVTKKKERGYKLAVSGMKWDSTVDPVHVKGVTREYHKQLYAQKYNNLDHFFKKQKMSKLNQYEIELNSSNTIKEIQFIIE